MVQYSTHAPTQAPTLCSENHHQVAGKQAIARPKEVSLRLGLGPQDPEPSSLQLLEGSREIRDSGNRQVLDGASAGPRDRWRERRRPPPRQDQAAGPGRLCYAGYRADVLRILDPIQGDEPARPRLAFLG